jgi:hypothetical protein
VPRKTPRNSGAARRKILLFLKKKKQKDFYLFDPFQQQTSTPGV